MKNRMNKMLVLALGAVSLTGSTGCIDSLYQNIWLGFGTSIGALPGNLVANYLAGLIGVPV